MKVRLVILLVVLIAVIVYVATKGTRTTDVVIEAGSEGSSVVYSDNPVGPKETLTEMDLPGEEPDVSPEFEIAVRRDADDFKQRIYFEITETHGFFAETFRVRFYFTPTGKGQAARVLVFLHYVNEFLEANGTLANEVLISDAELDDLIGGDMGSSENWSAEIVMHGRVRIENPDPSWNGWETVR